MIKSGYLKFNGKVQYMVDLHENETAIEVFDVSIDHKDSKNQPVYVKAFTDIKPETDKAPKFSNQSKLGLAVNRLFTDKHKPAPMVKVKEKRKVNPPLYIADIEEGIDTFDGKRKLGFYDRIPDKIYMLQNKVIKTEHSDRTGIFIGLDRIKWFKSYVPFDSVVDIANQKRVNNQWES